MTTEFCETEVLTCLPLIPEYDSLQHVVSVDRFRSAPTEFRYPEGVSIEECTGRIYVSDYCNSRIQVFSADGNHIHHFGSPHLGMPCGILIHGKGVYVSDGRHHAIFLFSISDFFLMKSVGKNGSENVEFDYPRQMTISPDQLIYIADCDNDRIQILSCNLDFRNSLRHQTLNRPVDVKFSDNQMLVLSRTDNPCVHMFTLSGEKMSSIITRGCGMQVLGAFFFFLDRQNNIIISDYSANNIKVFSSEGILLHTIGEYGHQIGSFNFPKGIAVLKHTQLVCVSENNSCIMQIFY